MAAPKKIFVCKSCGVTSPKWQGRCSSCGEWDTLVEEMVHKETPREEQKKVWRSDANAEPQPILLADIKPQKTVRISGTDHEFNRVLGGGIVPGTLVLLGGQPGIGKSTLLLQLALDLPVRVLYVSGEESEDQIKLRSERISKKNSTCFVLTETNTAKIFQHAQRIVPDLIIIDSIQTVMSPYIESTAGSVSQIRESAGELQRFAKETNIPILIIGHITKEGTIAGPKLLEHIVDVVLQFEGDAHYSYRILRTLKNRFGATDEMGIYEMQSYGLRPVANPSERLIAQRDEALSGSAICSTVEGVRPILIETQALVTRAVYGTPQRSATGFDLRRLSMLLAVLEKRSGLPFGMNDVFLNIAGGIKVEDPGMDLAVVAALISSLKDTLIPQNISFAAEVGLSGEIRAVTRIDQRIQEAARLGFETVYISKYGAPTVSKTKDTACKVVTISRIEDLIDDLF